jgi:cellobiose phosphorylase
MYRLNLECMLGLRLKGKILRSEPCLLTVWDGVKLHYRYRKTCDRIAVTQIHASENDKGDLRAEVMVAWSLSDTSHMQRRSAS